MTFSPSALKLRSLRCSGLNSFSILTAGWLGWVSGFFADAGSGLKVAVGLGRFAAGCGVAAVFAVKVKVSSGMG